MARSARSSLPLLIATFVAALVSAGDARAQQPNNPQVSVAENGVGSITFTGQAPIIVTGFMAADPGPGGAASALTFDLSRLGSPFLSGDILLYDGQVFADVIRFNGSTKTLVFYSNPDDGFDNAADIQAPPSAFYANSLTFQEVGLEGLGNGLFYVPTANQPGFVAGQTVSYFLASDVVTPEPASMALLATGLVGLAGMARRRLKAGQGV